jgi:hypothetical protein
MEQSGCKLCSYYPKADKKHLAFLINRHMHSQKHINKTLGSNAFFLCDEGSLEYYQDRVAYCDPINIRPVYMEHIRVLKERIAERAKLEQQAIDMGLESD